MLVWTPTASAKVFISDQTDISQGPVTAETITDLEEDDRLTQLIVSKNFSPQLWENISRLKTLKRLSIHGAPELSLRVLRRLPRLESLSLSSMVLKESDYKNLDEIRSLRSLGLTHCSISDANLSLIPRRIRKLSLQGNEITNEGALHVVERLPEIEVLHLDSTKVTDRVCDSLKGAQRLKILSVPTACVSKVLLTGLADLPSIENLAFTHIKEFTDSWMEPLKKTTTLRRVVLHSTSISDRSIEYLSNNKELDELRCGWTALTSDIAPWINHFEKLEILDLGSTSVDDGIFERLGPLPKLKTLNLGNCHLTHRCLEPVSKFESLESLSLDGANLAAGGIKHLSTMKTLRGLSLDACSLSDDCVDDLSRMVWLEELSLQSNKISPVGLTRITLSLPNCYVRTNARGRPDTYSTSSQLYDFGVWLLRRGYRFVPGVIETPPKVVRSIFEQEDHLRIQEPRKIDSEPTGVTVLGELALPSYHDATNSSELGDRVAQLSTENWIAAKVALFSTSDGASTVIDFYRDCLKKRGFVVRDCCRGDWSKLCMVGEKRRLNFSAVPVRDSNDNQKTMVEVLELPIDGNDREILRLHVGDSAPKAKRSSQSNVGRLNIMCPLTPNVLKKSYGQDVIGRTDHLRLFRHAKFETTVSPTAAIQYYLSELSEQGWDVQKQQLSSSYSHILMSKGRKHETISGNSWRDVSNYVQELTKPTNDCRQLSVSAERQPGGCVVSVSLNEPVP